MRSVVLGILLSCLFAFPGAAQKKHVMAVASKGLPGVLLMDADTDQVVCQVKTEKSPHEVAFSPNGRLVYLPVYGDTNLGVPGSNERTVHFLRSRDCIEDTSVHLYENWRPHGIAVGASGKLYVTTEITGTVSIVDAPNQAYSGSIPTNSKYSHSIIVTPDEQTAFVSNVMSKTISVLDLNDKKLIETIDVGHENQRLDLAPDGKQFVTSFWKDKQIAFFDVAARKVDHTVEIDGSALQPKYSADGKFVFAVGTAEENQIAVWKIDVAARKVVACVKQGIGESAASMTINPFTGNLYIADQAKDELVVVSPMDLTVVKRIATEKSPDGIAFAMTR